MTRYESIKNKSIEEMAAFLRDFELDKVGTETKYCELHCPIREKCNIDELSPDDCYDLEYNDCLKVWLSQEV